MGEGDCPASLPHISATLLVLSLLVFLHGPHPLDCTVGP